MSNAIDSFELRKELQAIITRFTNTGKLSREQSEGLADHFLVLILESELKKAHGIYPTSLDHSVASMRFVMSLHRCPSVTASQYM